MLTQGLPRYGFIHDQRLPEVAGRSAREQKMLEKEMSRVEKWLVMIKEKDKWFNTKKLSERVWKVKCKVKSDWWLVVWCREYLRD